MGSVAKLIMCKYTGLFLFVNTFVIVYVHSAKLFTVYLLTVREPSSKACLPVDMDLFYKCTSHRLFHAAYIVH